MHLLIGADTPLGQAFCLELTKRGIPFLPLALADRSFGDLHAVYELLRKSKPEFVINAGTSGHLPPALPNEAEKQCILYSHVLVPQTIAQACKMRNVPWLHISCGKIFQGAKILQQGRWITELDLTRPHVARLIASGSDRIQGFSENDDPNHSFLCPPCDFEAGAVALGEQVISNIGSSYLCRHGILLDDDGAPFETCRGEPHNRRARSCYVSATLRSDFARACLELRERRAAYGSYNVVNPGIFDLGRSVSSRNHLTEMRGFILDNSKMRRTGIILRHLGSIPASTSCDVPASEDNDSLELPVSSGDCDISASPPWQAS